MKLSKLPVAVLVAMTAMAVVGTSWAGGGHHHHGHASVGVVIGGPVWPWYYPYRPYPYSYYYPPVVAVPASPPPPTVYVEQQGEAPAAENYWYYCNSSKTYFPYVQQCPEGWQRVMPRPPS